jgi:phthiocerol/phenolphthiocerol synthesis type-I polyketide synthase C
MNLVTALSPEDHQESAGTLTESIAVIGVSGRYPGGANSPELLWETLASGRDAVGEAQGDRWSLGWHHPDAHRQGRVYTRAGGFLDRVDGFDAEFFGLSPREARQMDPQQRLLLELAWEAHEDAGIAPRSRAGSDTGVFVGISSNDYASLVGAGWPDAYSNTGSSFSIAANRISYIFNFHGPSVASDTACSSSIVCVHQACMSLLAGECSTALAGGVSILSHIRPWLGFARASMLSPTGRCKSFDASGDGYVRSEGGGLVLLKPLAAAERDGDRILGVILASGVNSDGRTVGLSMPNGEAQERLLRKVYGQCGVRAEDVFYVEAHGTGTAVGDPIECGALGRVLGSPREDASHCLIGSVKSNIGHLEAASGIAGLTKALLILKHREIPGNLHFVDPNPKIDFEGWKLEVVTKATALPERERPVVIGINSFGFGGTNAHVALQEYRGPDRSKAAASAAVWPSAAASTSVLVISGNSEAGLRAVAGSYRELLGSVEGANWAEICAAAATERSPLRFRLALVADSSEEAAGKLDQFLAGTVAAGMATGEAATDRAAIAFVYSGNGPQWWGMGRELLAENATFRAEIEAVDAIFAPLAGWSLLEEMARPESENRIALTEVAQPMLFALQLGLTAVLREAGVVPSAVLGHSVGEAAAAFACGALTREQATRVIFHRSTEQARTAGMGRMAALGVGAEEARAAMAGIPGWLELAATNSPQSVTVAGDPVALGRMVEAMTAAGKFARLLPLDYPFHTRAMEPIREGLVASLDHLVPAASTLPFISTVEGEEKAGDELDAEYWYRNVREPVRFAQAVSHLLQGKGVAVFLEIGPHPVLKEYVLQSARAAASSAVALPTLRRPGRGGPEPETDNLQTAICACHAHGASDLSALFRRPSHAPQLPLYPWQRERHWRGSVALPDTFTPIERDHPLLGSRLPSSDALWENPLDTHQLPYLKDHVVQEAVLFPAAGYIELALTAARIALGSTVGNGALEVETFDILRPLAIPAQSDPLIQTRVDARDGTVEISSRTDRDATEWTTHVRCRVSRIEGRADDQPAEPANLAEISARTPMAVSAEQHYAGAKRRGLAYGPWFQGVGDVLLSSPERSEREALAEISLPMLAGKDLAGYQAHPALLDACIQVLITLIAQKDTGNSSTIPVQVGRVRSFAPLTSSMFCHVLIQSESERSVVADFHVMDGDGKLLMTIEQARCQKVDFAHAGASPLTSEWWRPDARAAALAVPAALQAPSATRAGLAGEPARIAEENGRAEFYREIALRMARLVGAYAVRAVEALAPATGTFDLARLARQGKVRREQAGLLTRLVEIAEEDGQIESAGGSGWRWNQGRVPEDPAPLWRALFEEHPRYQAELLLVAHAGETLVARLRGQDAGEAPQHLSDQLQDTSPFQAPYNQVARAAIESMVAAWPAERPMRVLEVSGAGGGLAAWVLPALPAERVDYVFTDASEALLARAEHRFAAHRFVRFAALDLSRDLLPQGQPAGYFDLVLGANAVGSVSDTRALLARLKAVMAPGGQVLLVEARPDRFIDLVFGPRSAFGAEELAAAGFEDVAVLDDGGEASQQSVLLAQLAASGSGEREKAPADEAARVWMLVVEAEEPASEFVRALEASLVARGQTVSVHCFDGEDAVAEAVEAAAPQELVYIAGRGAIAGHGASDGQSFIETEEQRCLNAVRLVQALEAVRQETPCALAFVTRGAFPTANGQAPVDPGQASLWGLGRVIGNEHSGLNLRMIDLHASADDSEAARWLAEELLRRDDETEVQISAGYRYTNRERLTTLTDEARHASAGRPTDAAPEAFALDFEPRGGLDSLYLREAERRDPAPGEVEIAVKAAGLNFRDVLWTMGMLPEEAVEHGFSGPTIGMECAGEVLRVGAEVTGIKPGDRVVAFASNCFGSHVTTDAGSVARLPDAIDYAAAATIPTAFLTAYYAFDYLARLEPGETVLIHGAAGGVGLAAIQIAKLKGAKVIGTAGSARKRGMLALLGVDHVLNSRSLEFADEVMKLTGGVGVDVVLNSLAGEAITKSLQCLRPFGRFLEIGKRDLYANSRIGLRPFRNNLSYFGIDADTLLIDRPVLARSLFQSILDHFAAGRLRPLPFQAVPISRAAEAFRAMQQSRHVGKLVVSTELDRHASLAVVRSKNTIRAGVTYLVTGGLGGFGLSTARWLVEQGASSLALLSRRGATTDEAPAGVRELEAAGATVRAFAVDISDGDALAEVLATIRAEMAPLAGVLHSAAVIEDAPISNLGAEQLDRVFRPKLLGAWNLHQQTLGDALDMFVLYSSSSAVIGNPGQGAYVAANLSLDALALYRRSVGLPALSVGWGAIKDAGFLTRHEAVAGMLKARTGLDATPARELLADLGRLLAVGATRVSVARFDLQKLAQMLPGARVPRFLPIVPKGGAAALEAEETLAEVLKTVPAGERRAFVLARVREHAARVLGTAAAQVIVDKPLADLGLDSLMAVELAGGLERDLGQPVSVMQMLSATSLTAIAELMMKIAGVEREGVEGAPAAASSAPSSSLVESVTT